MTEQDAFWWHVSQCHPFNSLWALSSPSRLLSTHKCPNQTLTNKHTHTSRKCTYTHIVTDQPGLLSERLVHHDWLNNPCTCANNFLSPGDKVEGRRRKKRKLLRKMMGKIPIVCLYETSFPRGREQKKKNGFIPFCIVEMIDLLSQ